MLEREEYESNLAQLKAKTSQVPNVKDKQKPNLQMNIL